MKLCLWVLTIFSGCGTVLAAFGKFQLIGKPLTYALFTLANFGNNWPFTLVGHFSTYLPIWLQIFIVVVFYYYKVRLDFSRFSSGVLILCQYVLVFAWYLFWVVVICKYQTSENPWVYVVFLAFAYLDVFSQLSLCFLVIFYPFVFRRELISELINSYTGVISTLKSPFVIVKLETAQFLELNHWAKAKQRRLITRELMLKGLQPETLTPEYILKVLATIPETNIVVRQAWGDLYQERVAATQQEVHASKKL